MWVSVSLQAVIVWEEVEWRATAVWQDTPDGEHVVMEKRGRVPLPPDGGPDEALVAAAAALVAGRVGPRPWAPASC